MGLTSKEENIAVRLSGRIKNFTGKGPAVIKVKFDKNLATVQLKWVLNNLEKSFLKDCINQDLVETMRSKLYEDAKGNLSRAFSQVFKSDIRIVDVKEELLQEKISFQVEVDEIAC